VSRGDYGAPTHDPSMYMSATHAPSITSSSPGYSRCSVRASESRPHAHHASVGRFLIVGQAVLDEHNIG